MVKRRNDVDMDKVFTVLSHRLLGSSSDFYVDDIEKVNILLDLVTRTVEKGESNSVLVLGPHGVGKTVLVEKVLRDAHKQKSWSDNAVIVNLNGFIAVDDKIALKEITRQLNLENVVGERVFGSFSDHLNFLLSSLKSGDKTSKPIIFILEEFDMFCNHKNQTLLYNLFDIAQSQAVPICVIGISCQIDVTELLEKRVNSRFSHRYIHMRCYEQVEDYLSMLSALLKLDKQSGVHNYDIWNKNVDNFVSNPEIQNLIKEKIFVYDKTISFMKNILYACMLKLAAIGKHELTREVMDQALNQYSASSSNQPLDFIIRDLSILEICILIAVKHISEIYDNEPFNFEMVFHEYVKFRRRRLTSLTEERSVIFKCWEHLISLELIVPKTSVDRSRSQQLEFILNVFHLPGPTMKKAVEKYPNCPTEVIQWLGSSTHNSGSFN